jgi:hypothetical protein
MGDIRSFGVRFTVAWVSLKLSVTLAALLTASLLPMALWIVRRSVSFAAMTLAMLGMIWRGEAWKTVCLRTEAELSRLLLQTRQLSPKTASFYQCQSPLCADAHYVSPYGGIVFRYGAEPFDVRMRPPDLHQSGFREIRQSGHSISPVDPLKYSEVCRALFPQQSDSNHAGSSFPRGSVAEPSLEKLYRIDPGQSVPTRASFT